MPDILRETNVYMYDTSLVLQVGFPYRNKTCKVHSYSRVLIGTYIW